MFEDDNIRTWIEQQHRFADDANRRSAEAFLMTCKNWAAQNEPDKIPVPKTPIAVRAVITLDPLTLRFEETGAPVSTLDPKSLLPVLPNTVGALGGDVGPQLKDERQQPIPGQYALSATCKKWPGETTIEQGRRFVQVAEGFAGARRYWQEIVK